MSISSARQRPSGLSDKAEDFWSRFGHRRFEVVIPICMVVLAFLSVLSIQSAQTYTGGSQWKMQAIFFVAGFALYIGISLIDYKILLDKGHFLYFGALGLLVIVLWTPLGTEMFGARRWINLGFIRLQPAEFAKIGTLIMIAGMLARTRIRNFRDSLNTLLKIALAVGVPTVLIFLQPDLGSTLVFPPMVLALLYVSRLSLKFFATAFALFALVIGIVSVDMVRYLNHLESEGLTALEGRGSYQGQSFLPLRDYQRERILAFAAPARVDPRGVGVSWNVNQSIISIASGGLWGKGLGESTQAKLGYLPSGVAHNDFIFSVLAEELGFWGGMLVIGLYSLMIYHGLRIASIARDRMGSLLAIGVCVIFMVHIFINIGMTIGVTPVTGLPLPLLSYGGSFVLTCCILLGILQSVYRFRREFA
jgi:rod shape determining protein RodA